MVIEQSHFTHRPLPAYASSPVLYSLHCLFSTEWLGYHMAHLGTLFSPFIWERHLGGGDCSIQWKWNVTESMWNVTVNAVLFAKYSPFSCWMVMICKLLFLQILHT